MNWKVVASADADVDDDTHDYKELAKQVCYYVQKIKWKNARTYSSAEKISIAYQKHSDASKK